MEGSPIIHPIQTKKNMKSTPAFPKFLHYESEEAYINECGWSEYIDLWNNYSGVRPLWWTFLKNETLKVKKIESNDIRMIMCTDPTFTRFGAAFDQIQNDRMKEHTETHYAQVGWTPFYGGLNQRIVRLETRGDTYVELDWTRFDGTIPVEVFSHIKNVRWFFHSDSTKTPENHDRYKWYVHNLINKVTLLPTGEVTYIKKGNPSGQISTTTDNNMVNTFLTAFEIAYMYKKVHGNVPTLEQFINSVDMICYGDDRLLSINSAFLVYDESCVPDLYKNIFGMWVKPENIKVSKKMEGLSFCGLTLIKDSGCYYGVPNVNKILSTIEHPNKKLPDIQALWGKLVSLRILTEYSPKKVKDYIEMQLFRVKEYAEAENIELPEVPNYFYRNIWTGGPNKNGGSKTQTTAA
nr:MAG: RNA-dependent RNA polymerase [Astroviridae sp.]